MLRLVAIQKCVGVYIVGVFRLDGDPSLVSWLQERWILPNAMQESVNMDLTNARKCE